MGPPDDKKVQFLVVDTTAFIQNAPLQDIAQTIYTCQEVVDEIVDKRQLRRLVVLPYDLQIKEAFPENIKIVTEFAKKTGDYSSLSAADIKVIALTYQLEKETVGIDHLRTEPLIRATLTNKNTDKFATDVTGTFGPITTDEDVNNKDSGLTSVKADSLEEDKVSLHDSDSTDDSSDESGWITPSNLSSAQKQLKSNLTEVREVKVACMTTDFAMQNVLKQMNFNVAALDGRLIKELRTFIFRCYACFKTTSVMTKKFCPKCGLDTLKKVAASLDEDGKLKIHINTRKPLTGRGKKFSLPRMKGGKHPNNPILAEDHPMPQNHASKLARAKVNPLDDDYVAGFSPFAVRDVTSRSAQLCIRPGDEVKHWMKKNPNEARRRRRR